MPVVRFCALFCIAVFLFRLLVLDCAFCSVVGGGELYEQVEVIGLDLCLVGGAVADGCTATVTFMYNDKSATGVGYDLLRP